MKDEVKTIRFRSHLSVGFAEEGVLSYANSLVEAILPNAVS